MKYEYVQKFSVGKPEGIINTTCEDNIESDFRETGTEGEE
jgi:hypothetical protein